MDIFEAIKSRRSCRSFLPDAIAESAVRQILEAANWAPSPANNQPWEFLVVTSKETKTRIAEHSDITKKQLFEKTGWKWMDKYKTDFLKDVPLIIAVIGDPDKSGAGVFMKGGENSY
ncbi:MAG: nitroreductase family protein, partial [Pseudomonadota bacterium]